MKLAVLILRDPTRQEIESTNKGNPPERALKQFSALYGREAFTSEHIDFRVDLTGTQILFMR